MSALTVTFLSSEATLTDYPSLPVLPLILILCLRNYAKLLVLKTLSSTGLEQSMVKVLLTLASVSFLLSFLILTYLEGTLAAVDFVAITIYIIN